MPVLRGEPLARPGLVVLPIPDVEGDAPDQRSALRERDGQGEPLSPRRGAPGSLHELDLFLSAIPGGTGREGRERAGVVPVPEQKRDLR